MRAIFKLILIGAPEGCGNESPKRFVLFKEFEDDGGCYGAHYFTTLHLFNVFHKLLPGGRSIDMRWGGQVDLTGDKPVLQIINEKDYIEMLFGRDFGDMEHLKASPDYMDLWGKFLESAIGAGWKLPEGYAGKYKYAPQPR